MEVGPSTRRLFARGPPLKTLILPNPNIKVKTINFKKPSTLLGDLNVQRALRKQHQISNILTAVKPLVRPGCRIVDFCAGGGHVGIVLAYFLKDCEVFTTL